MDPKLQDQLIAKYPVFFQEPPNDCPTPFHWRLNLTQRIAGIQCLDGWYSLIDEAVGKIVELDPLAQVSQVKEKWGELRIYLRTPHSEVIRDVIRRARDLSRFTCDVCGGHGRIGNLEGQVATRCPEHMHRMPLRMEKEYGG